MWSAAKELRVKLATGESGEVQGVWDRYQELSQRSLLGIGVVAVRAPLKERLRAQADRVIADFRQNEPTVREAQWREAATWLTDLLHLDPGDRAATARLRYCEGQLQRITGEARKRKKQPATQPLRDAVARFEEAGAPRCRAGPTRTWAWRAPTSTASRTSTRRLPPCTTPSSAATGPGNRELVQLADGYRNRADRMRREATAVKGLEQERTCLEKAAADYTQAIEIYRQGDRLRRRDMRDAAGAVAPRRGAARDSPSCPGHSSHANDPQHGRRARRDGQDAAGQGTPRSNSWASSRRRS